MEDTVSQIFADAGLRCTQQRMKLYSALSASDRHPTADELFQMLAGESLSLATVYNTLEAFCQAGIAQKLPAAGPSGSARYDACCHDHLHLRCRTTGRVADAPASLSDELIQHIPAETLAKLEKQIGFKIDQVQIELVGAFTDDVAAAEAH